MALTRRALKAMGIEEDKIDEIITMHTETVDGLKADLAKYKADAETLPDLQRKLEQAQTDLETAKKDGFKEQYDTVKKEFDDYKAEVVARETKAAKERAVRAYYESKGITGKALEIAIRGSGAEIEALELEGDKIKDPTALEELVNGTFSGLISTTETRGAQTLNPPANSPAKIYTRDDIRKMSPTEINQNFDAIKASLKGETQ